MYLKSAFQLLTNFMNATEIVLIASSMVYRFLEEDDMIRPGLGALATFCAYIRLIKVFLFFKKTRQLVHTVLQVASKSVSFVLIVIIFITGIVFARIALDDSENFYTSLQKSFGMTFGDFEDAYSTKTGFIGFVVFTYAVPLLLLNLLITIMSDI